MPSPIGHVIAGVAAGWVVAGAPSVAPFFAQQGSKVPGTFWREAALFGALGAVPDFDLLIGAHSGPIHSIGAAIIVGIVAGIVACVAQRVGVRRLLGLRPLTLAVACLAAYSSHVLLDWLGRDSSPPIGIMALWPVSSGYFECAFHVFMPISRRYNQGWTFVAQNAIALVRELLILVPLLTVTILFRSRSDSR